MSKIKYYTEEEKEFIRRSLLKGEKINVIHKSFSNRSYPAFCKAVQRQRESLKEEGKITQVGERKYRVERTKPTTSSLTATVAVVKKNEIRIPYKNVKVEEGYVIFELGLNNY